MPIHTLMNKTKRSKSKGIKQNRKALTRKKKQEKAKHIIIEDSEFLSREQLKKLSKQPTNNIRASGKRKRKMLKRLRHQMKDKNQMEVELTAAVGSNDKIAVMDIDKPDHDVDMK